MTDEAVKSNQEQHGKLMKKMAEVIKLSKNVEKKGQNKEQGYKFATHSDIIEELRKHIADQGLFILPKPKSFDTHEVISRNGAKGVLMTMKMEFEITDTETGYSIVVEWFGQGLDYGDKALYKSYTGALKYFLLDTFMISTGDDAENETPETATAPRTYQAPKITQEQINKIGAVLVEKGKTEEDLKKYVLASFKVADWRTMNYAQANMTLKKMEALPNADEKVDVDEVDAGIEAQKLEKGNGAVGTTTEPK